MNYIKARANFQRLLAVPRTPSVFKQLDETWFRLQALARQIHGNATLEYSPAVDTRTIKLLDRKFLEALKAEEGELVNTNWLASYAKNVYGTNNLEVARRRIVNTMHSPARKIQRAFRASRLTKNTFMKLWNKPTLSMAQLMRMHSYVQRHGGNYNAVHRKIRAQRNASPRAAPAVTKIQKSFRKYRTHVIEPRRQFLRDLAADGRFNYYVDVLTRLEYKVAQVRNMIRRGNGAALSVITNVVGVCHYSKRPAATTYTGRKSLALMKKKTPREYLEAFRRQFSYVASAYSRMSPANKRGYRDRLAGELGNRPCLENLLESLVKALSKAEFVWLGKTKNFENSPLMPNNARYLGKLMNTAVSTWGQSLYANASKRPKNFNAMNLNTRKQLFWNMVKALPVPMYLNGVPINGMPQLYNEKGRKFKKSKIANVLENI